MRRETGFVGRIALGFLASTPLLFIALVLMVILGVRSSAIDVGKLVMTCAVATLVLYGVTVGYFLYIVQTEARLPPADKARWTYILLLWFPFAAIWFWYRFIWRDAAGGER
jgi:hypothetical protein